MEEQIHQSGTAQPLKETMQEIIRSLKQQASERHNLPAGSKFKVCPHCFGAGLEIVTGKGARPCRCRKWKTLRSIYNSPKKVPAEFFGPDIEKIKPFWEEQTGCGHPRQAKAIEILRANANESILLAGENKCGKTRLAFALWKYGIRRKRKPYFNTIDALVKEYIRVETFQKDNRGEYFIPSLSPENLEIRNERRVILLDEVDAANPTLFACQKLFYFLKTAHEFRHQVIMTSNRTIEDLQSIWSKHDPVWGAKIASRMDRCVYVDLFPN